MKYAILYLWIFVISIGTIVAESSMVYYYVSPEGDDTCAGTKEAPFRTFERAVRQVETSKINNPETSITVYFREGAYPVFQLIHLTEKGSGSESAPVIYAAYPGEKPLFRGSVELTQWKPLRDKSVLKRLKPEVGKHLVVADLASLGIADHGDPILSGNRPELSYKNEWQVLARWPNRGFTYAGEVLGKTLIPKALNGNSGAKEGLFTYLDKNIDRWASEPDGKLGGYWFWDWGSGYQNIGKIDTNAKTISLEDACGYRHGLRFFGLNILCELDTAGEWYLDRSKDKLYWYPPAGTDPVKNPEDIRLSVMNAPFMIHIEDCSYVTLEGLSFAETRGSGICIEKGKNCSLLNCRLERIGRDGIHIKKGTGHEINGCLLRWLGHAGISMEGGERKRLVPANFVLTQTVVEHFSLFGRTYCPAVRASGCGIYIGNNRFSHASSSAMSLGGNDIVAEYNQIDHVVTESDDQGGFDLYLNPSFQGLVLRYNRWSDIHGGTHYGAAGIRLDDLISGVEIYGNLFERCGSYEFGAIQIHGGSNNLVEDNLFYDCSTIVSFTPYGKKDWQEAFNKLHKQLYEEVDINSLQYRRKYPLLQTITENIDMNIIRNNLAVDCDSLFFRDNGIQITSGNHSVVSDGQNVEYFCCPDLLHSYGIKAVPMEKMGVTHNQWIENEN